MTGRGSHVKTKPLKVGIVFIFPFEISLLHEVIGLSKVVARTTSVMKIDWVHNPSLIWAAQS